MLTAFSLNIPARSRGVSPMTDIGNHCCHGLLKVPAENEQEARCHQERAERDERYQERNLSPGKIRCGFPDDGDHAPSPGGKGDQVTMETAGFVVQ